jgi:Pyruvate/2-oxoacid:ferredoxin oxidoreductase delta subunit/flavodoxin
MPTVHIHYFTGTGNTARAVEILRQRFQENGYDCLTVRVAQGVSSPEGNPDLHLVAFPVLSWAAPVMMRRYLRRLPVKKGENVAVLAINGATSYKGRLVDGYTGQALEQVEALLRRKGMHVLHTGNASYPENWTQMTNPCDTPTQALLLAKGDAAVETFGKNVLEGNHSLYRCGIGNILWSWCIGMLFGGIGRRVLGTFFIADERCTGCSLCAQTCPAKTIVMEHQRPRWKTRCEDCNRCINLCPERAIQVSMPLLCLQLTLHLALTVGAIVGALDLSKTFFGGTPWLHTFAAIAFIGGGIFLAVWLTLVPLARFLELLQRIPGLRRWFSKSLTRNFRRYLAPGFKPWERKG